jgi:DNA polymerase III, delta subunit
VKSEPIGRDAMVRRLTPLPPCTALLSPHSTGKRTVLSYAVHQQGVQSQDFRLYPSPYTTRDKGVRRLVEPDLTINMVREAKEWAAMASRFPSGKVLAFRLSFEREDGTRWIASQRVQNALLKLLEEPPQGCRCVILADNKVLPTITSRSVVISAGLLSPDDVFTIIKDTIDTTHEEVWNATQRVGGRVRPVKSLLLTGSKAATMAQSALVSLDRGDAVAVVELAREWSAAATTALVLTCHRYLQGISPVDSSVTPSVARDVLQVLRETDGARSRVVLSALAGRIAR